MQAQVLLPQQRFTCDDDEEEDIIEEKGYVIIKRSLFPGKDSGQETQPSPRKCDLTSTEPHMPISDSTQLGKGVPYSEEHLTDEDQDLVKTFIIVEKSDSEGGWSMSDFLSTIGSETSKEQMDGSICPLPLEKVTLISDIHEGDYLVMKGQNQVYDYHAVVKSVDIHASTYILYEFTHSDENGVTEFGFKEITKVFETGKSSLLVLRYNQGTDCEAMEASEDCTTPEEKILDEDLLKLKLRNDTVTCKAGVPTVEKDAQEVATISDNLNKIITLLKSAFSKRTIAKIVAASIALVNWVNSMLLIPYTVVEDKILKFLSCWESYKSERAILDTNNQNYAQDLATLKSKYMKLLLVHTISVVSCIGASAACGVFITQCMRGVVMGAAEQICSSILVNWSIAMVGRIFYAIPWMFVDLFNTNSQPGDDIVTSN